MEFIRSHVMAQLKEVKLFTFRGNEDKAILDLMEQVCDQVWISSNTKAVI